MTIYLEKSLRNNSQNYKCQTKIQGNIHWATKKTQYDEPVC